MALSIKTEKADRLARTLSRLTGETMTEAVTRSLAERLERVRKTRRSGKDLADRLAEYTARVRVHYDTNPVSKAEWDAGWGEKE